MTGVSAAICCQDNEDTIGAALESVAWADEIVVVDSGSRDSTREIAERYAHRVVTEPWRGYTRQKEYSAEICRNDWVLILDSDEECSAQLAEEIRALRDEELDARDVFVMPRRNFVMGRYVRAWSPDWQSRLIHRERCRWADETLHDQRLPSSPERQGKLRGPILHKRCGTATFRDYFDGRLEDGRLLDVARQMYGRGRRCRWWDLLLHPALTFLKFYVIKGAFLDGQFGWLIGQKAAMGTRLKYAALWAVQHGVEPPEPPGSEDSARDTGSEDSG